MSSAEPPSAALPPISSETVLLRLLQRAARNPEDLIEEAVKLSLVGLLSRETLADLCKSVGLGDAQSATVLQSQRALSIVRSNHTSTGSDANVTIHALLGGTTAVNPNGKAPSVLSLLQPATPTALALPSVTAQPAAAQSQPSHSLISPMTDQSFGLGGFGAGSRLASEFKHPMERLGQGGGGAVYRARHLLDGSEYAIKRVTFWSRPGAPAASESSAQRVLREVHALAQLNHPNVCRYYSAWVETDWPSFFNTVGGGGGGRAGTTAPPPLRLLPAPPVDVGESYTSVDESRVSEGTGSPSLRGLDGPSPPLKSARAPNDVGMVSPASAVDDGGAEISASSGWDTSRPAADSTSLSGIDFIGCPLNASILGGAAAAMLGGSDAALEGSAPSSPPVSRRDGGNRWAERFSSMSSNGSDEQSWSSSASNSPTNHKISSTEPRRTDAAHAQVPNISPVTKRRQASGERGGHSAPPSALLHQWSYRKSLLIQMELCEPNTLKDYLQQRDALAFTSRADAGVAAVGGSVAADERAYGGVRGVSVARSMECLVQICQGLEHVHECGIVHRDLKVRTSPYFPTSPRISHIHSLLSLSCPLSTVTSSPPTAASRPPARSS